MPKAQRRKSLNKRFRKNKNKTNRQKRNIKDRREAKKYIELLNHAYKTISSSFHDLLDKEDYLLLPYLKTGFNRGWRVLKDKNIVKEIKCNSLCMTISILNSTIGNRKSLDDLNPLQKLYLFFISYLVQDSKLSKKEVDLKHALRKLDLEIQYQINRKNEYIKKGDNRNIKKCDKVIIRREEAKEQLIESSGKNRSGLERIFNLDVCREIDCEYLHEYQMKKGLKYSESYSKFCNNITELFKGVVWLNMNQIFGKIFNPFKVDIINSKLELNLNIRKSINNVDIIFIPDDMMYGSDLFYGNSTLERARRKAYDRGDEYWVYNGIDTHRNVLMKRSIHLLEDKHYVVAQMQVNEGPDWKAPDDIKAKIKYQNFKNFEKGIGKLPILKDIRKTIKNIGGKDKYNLEENIENSITLHWLYIHRDQLVDYIRENIV